MQRGGFRTCRCNRARIAKPFGFNEATQGRRLTIEWHYKQSSHNIQLHRASTAPFQMNTARSER